MRKTKLFLMKKSTWLVFGIAMLILSLVAPASAKEFTLRLQCFTAGWEMNRLVKTYIPLVEKLTNGTVKIKAFPVNSLVPMKETLNALRSGVIDMAMIPEGYFAGLVPVSQIAAGLPYTFRSLDEAAFFMWNRGFVDILRKDYAKQNVYVIPVETFGVGLMTKKPIKRIEDLRGKKIRSFGSMAEWLRECGASTVFIPGGELYTALATGVAEGAHWGDAATMYEMKFQEVLKNYMLPEPILGGWWSIGINMDLWNKFTSEQRNAIEAATMAAGRIIYRHTRVIYSRAIKDMAKNWSVQVTTLSKEEQEKAKEYAKKSWERIAKKNPRNAEAIEMIKDFLQEEEVLAKVPLPWPW